MADMTIKDIERIATDLEGHARDCQHWLDRAEHYGRKPEMRLHEDGLRSSEAASALRQLLKERRWRPIETAPGLDGNNRILVWSSRHPPSDQVQIRLADGEFWRREKVGPSHWQPLPLPPSPEEENGE